MVQITDIEIAVHDSVQVIRAIPLVDSTAVVTNAAPWLASVAGLVCSELPDRTTSQTAAPQYQGDMQPPRSTAAPRAGVCG
jgi:hypothetical protein